MKTVQVIVSVILIVAAILIVSEKLRSDKVGDPYEDARARVKRFHAQANPALEKSITNSTGYRRTLSSFVFSGDATIKTWKATAEYEVLNRAGGVERVNEFFAFGDYGRSLWAKRITADEFAARTNR